MITPGVCTRVVNGAAPNSVGVPQSIARCATYRFIYDHNGSKQVKCNHLFNYLAIPQGPAPYDRDHFRKQADDFTCQKSQPTESFTRGRNAGIYWIGLFL